MERITSDDRVKSLSERKDDCIAECRKLFFGLSSSLPCYLITLYSPQRISDSSHLSFGLWKVDAIYYNNTVLYYYYNLNMSIYQHHYYYLFIFVICNIIMSLQWAMTFVCNRRLGQLGGG